MSECIAYWRLNDVRNYEEKKAIYNPISTRGF